MSVTTLHLLLRISARLSGSVFLVGFTAPAVARLWPSGLTRRWGSAERTLLLTFVLLHTVHLVLIMMLAQAMGSAFFHPATGKVLGGIDYLIIYALAVSLIRNRSDTGSLNLRQTASYVIWATFAVAFTASLPKYHAVWPIVLGCFVAVIVRQWAEYAVRRQVNSAATA